MAGSIVRRNLIGALGVLVVLLLVLVALFAEQRSPFEATAQVGTRLTPPNAQYVLGLDQLGRDVLSRIIYGARVALEVSLASVGAAVGIGGGVGGVRGDYG